MDRTVTHAIGGATDPEVRLRLEWAQELKDAMAFRRVNVYELQRRLGALGITVSRQAVESWIAGKTAPRPYYQQAIGTALDLPARPIFQLENLPSQAC